ncbi:3553_t:CDS:1, partial [Ambispora leptoticha]
NKKHTKDHGRVTGRSTKFNDSKQPTQPITKHSKTLPHNKSHVKPNQLLGINETFAQSSNKPNNSEEPTHFQGNRSQTANLLPRSILRKNCDNQKQNKRKVSFAEPLICYSPSKPNRSQKVTTKRQLDDRSVTSNTYVSDLRDLSTLDINDISENNVILYIKTFDEKITEYAKTIKDACFSYLVNDLPSSLNSFDTNRHHHHHHDDKCAIETGNGMCHNDGYQRLLDIYARLPFSWLKRVIESENLGVTSIIRYKLAKDIITKRQELKISNKDEFAYMSFGTNHHQNITIVQKRGIKKR